MYVRTIFPVLLLCFFLRPAAQEKELLSLDWIKKTGAQKFPSSKKIYRVSDYGFVGDSTKVITNVIQKAIDDCSKKGGGIVTFKPGVYLTGSVFVKSNVHLKIDKNVLVKGSQNFDDYPEIDTRIELSVEDQRIQGSRRDRSDILRGAVLNR